MGNTVSLTQSIDDRAVVDAFNRQLQLLDKLERKLDSTGQKGRAAGEQSAAAGDKFAGSLTKIVGAVGGLAAVAATLRAELEKVQRLEDQLRNAQVGAGESFRRAKVNFTPDATVRTNAELERALRDVSKTTGANLADVARSSETALSAKGDLSNRAAIEAIRQAYRLDPRNAGQADVLSGSFLDLAKITGNQDIRANAGFLRQVQGAARVTSPQFAGQNLVPAIGALVAQGATPEQAAEYAAALTQLNVDPTGATSGTALISLGAQLGKFVPQARGKDARGGFAVPQAQIAAYGQAQGPAAQIAILQQSPELRRQFLAGASFEAKSRESLLGLLSNDPRAAAALGAARRSITAPNAAQAQDWEQFISGLDQGEFDPLRQLNQASETALQESQLNDPLGARRAAVRKILAQTKGRFDYFGPDQLNVPLIGDVGAARWGEFEFEARQKLTNEAPEQSAIGILQRQSESVRFRDDKEAQQYFKELIAELKNLQTQLRETNSGLKENSDATKANTRRTDVAPEAALSRQQ